MKCKQTWISPSRIAVFLIASLGLAAAGVSAQVPGAGQPSSQTMQRQSATPLLSSSLSFVAVRAYDSGGLDPESVVIADVNLDGKLDVVAANYSATVGVLLGNGDGTFQPTVSYYSGAGFTAAVAIADVNLDGKPDLIVADAYENSYGVLLGNGDGTFQPVVTYTGFGGWAVAVADFNRDGKPDLAMPNSYPNTIGVLLGRGDGTFQDPVFYDPGGDYCNGLAAADLNHDGKADLVVTSAEAAGVLLGNGDGTFQPSVTYPTGGNFYPESDSPVIADVNRMASPIWLWGIGHRAQWACFWETATVRFSQFRHTRLSVSSRPLRFPM